MISAALPDPPPRCSSPPLLHHLRSSPPRPEPRRPRIINHQPLQHSKSNGNHAPEPGASLASPAVVAAALAGASRKEEEEVVVAAVAALAVEEEQPSEAAGAAAGAAVKDSAAAAGLPVPPPRHCRKRPARPPIPEEGRGAEVPAANEGSHEGNGVLHPWERGKRVNGGNPAPLGRRSLRASRDSLCALPAEDQVDGKCEEEDDKADHWLLLPRRALAMDERQLRQDLAGLRFSMNLLDGQGAGSGNVWLCE